MKGNSSGLYLLNSYFNNTIQNFQAKGLKKNTYSSRIGVFQQTSYLDWETSSDKLNVSHFLDKN